MFVKSISLSEVFLFIATNTTFLSISLFQGMELVNCVIAFSILISGQLKIPTIGLWGTLEEKIKYRVEQDG